MDSTPIFEQGCVWHTESFTSEIVRLRAGTEPGTLREMSIDEIRARIHDFYLVTLNGESIGCFRIFEPATARWVLELGSVVGRENGLGKLITTVAMDHAKSVRRKIIALTTHQYGTTLEKSGWRRANGQFPVRENRSPGKEVWMYSPNASWC